MHTFGATQARGVGTKRTVPVRGFGAVTVGIAEERKNIVLQREVEQHSQDETHFPLPLTISKVTRGCPYPLARLRGGFEWWFLLVPGHSGR